MPEKLLLLILLSASFVPAVSAQDNLQSAPANDDSAEFRKMNGVILKQPRYKQQSAIVQRAEWLLSSAFCQAAKGKTRALIDEQVGLPWLYRGDSVLELKPNGEEKHVVYLFGLTPCIVRLAFKDEVCWEALCCGYANDPWYESWLIEHFSAPQIGRTVKKVIECEGEPFEVTTTNGKLLSEAEARAFKSRRFLKNGIIDYSVGGLTHFKLQIVDNVCTGVTQILSTGRHEKFEHKYPVFRVPNPLVP